MQEHPIPQDITGYRFHIIGSMTLKQFGEIFLGVIIAVIIYNTNLISFIKWPLIILSVGIGGLAAFVPFEERPFDHWIVTFFKTLYKPTKFYWRREAIIPDVFLFETDTTREEQEPEINLTPAKRQRIKEYIGSVPELRSDEDYTDEEILRMKSILDSFDAIKVQPQVTRPIVEKPRLDIRIRNMREPSTNNAIVVFNDSFEEDRLQMTLPTQAKIIEDIIPRQEHKKVIMDTSQVAQGVHIPKKSVIKTVSESQDKKGQEINVRNSSDLSERAFSQVSKKTDEGKAKTQISQDATYNQDLPFPTAPSEPNKLVGMILSQNNDLLSNAIVEIQTPEGNIERAVKTNPLGQFFITTPLKPGEYNLIIEKEGYTFQPQHIIVNNEIISPMEIRSIN
jgi:hypothetical protein